MTLMIWLKRSGLIFLGIGLVSIVIAAALPATHDWTPVRMPISLAPGNISSPEFKTDLGTNYEINIEVDRKIDFYRLNCLLGIQNSSLESCNGLPSLIDMSWSVMSHGTTVASGSSNEVHDGGWGPTIERTIGRFRADKGSRYVVQLNIKRDASELAVANPRLDIGVHPAKYEGNMIWAMSAATMGWGSILLSLLTFIIFAVAHLLKKRKRLTSPPSA